MYTQCSHCKAVFRVTMKELTAAQGLLRCGECDTIFDAMKALSTTLPEERTFATNQLNDTVDANTKPADTRIRVLPANHASKGKNKSNFTAARNSKAKAPARSRKLLWLSLAALAILLILQLLYTSRAWFMEQPLTSDISRRICTFIGCEMQTPRNVKKIRVMSRSVYSHPNAPEHLIISSSIQNDASFAQPYPTLEISFYNSESEVVALRRFKPEEYIGEKKSGTMMPSGTPEEFSVHIADPGKEAVNFQFRFL